MENEEMMPKYGLTLVHIAFLAYALERGEPLAVQSATIESILATMVEKNQVPEVMIDDGQEGYIKFGTVLRDVEEENQ